MGRAIIYLALLSILTLIVVLAIVMPMVAAKSRRRQHEAWEQMEIQRLEVERRRHDELGG